MPTEDEAALLRTHIDASGTEGLSDADDFLWRMLHVPRVGPRLRALGAASTTEGASAYLRRQLDVVSSGCEQALTSVGLRGVLGVVLAVGNAMNEGNALRGGASGFGLEALSKLMTVKSTTNGGNQAATLLHYCAEQLSAISAKTADANADPTTTTKPTGALLRAELRRVPDAATIDVGELRREATRLFKDVDELEEEVRHAKLEAAETDAEADVNDTDARSTQLRQWADEALPADLWDTGDGFRRFCARRVCAVLEEGLASCQEQCTKLRAALDSADDAYARLEAAFGAGAVVSESDAGGGGGGSGGGVPPARQILIELSKFGAALDKADKDNARQHNLAASLRKLRQTPPRQATPSAPAAPMAALPPTATDGERYQAGASSTGAPAAHTLASSAPESGGRGGGSDVYSRQLSDPTPPGVSLAHSWPLFDESRLFPELIAPPPSATPCTPRPLSRLSGSDGRLSSGDNGSGDEPRVRRSSSLPEGGEPMSLASLDMQLDDQLIDQAEKLLSRPRPAARRRGAGGVRPASAGSGASSTPSPRCTPEASDPRPGSPLAQARGSAYDAEEEYF